MRKIIMKQKIAVEGVFALCITLVLFCFGCAGTPQGELFPELGADYAWPKSPEEPRIKYLGAISTESDLKKGVSWTEGIRRMFFGKEKIGALVSPYAIAVDDHNRMFVGDIGGGVVHMFDMDERDYHQFGNLKGDEKLLMPIGLAIAESHIYVVDSELHKIVVFDTEGNFIFDFGEEHFTRPAGIAYLESKKLLYISDAASHVIKVFTKEGRLVRKIGSRGTKKGYFNFPTHLWIDEKEQLYVSDTLNYRIQVFTSGGDFVKSFGRHGDRPGSFAHPSGVSVDSSGNIYVIDRQYENFQIFDEFGKILMAIGVEGSEPGQFWLPGGIFVDKNKKIYVADSFNKRVQVFALMDGMEHEK
jgi:hypothetical protein